MVDVDRMAESAGGGAAYRLGPLAALVAIEGYALVLWLHVGRKSWFYRDEWDFISRRTAGNLGDLFRSHNGHWCTLPLLAYRMQYHLFGVREYFTYRFLVLALYLVVAALLFTIMRRSGVSAWIALAAIAAFALLGPGWQNILRPFQITFVASLALGLSQLLLVDHEGPVDRRDRWALAAGLLALMTSSIALVTLCAVGLALVMRRRWVGLAWQVVPLTVAYITWVAVIGRRGAFTIGPTGTGPSSSARSHALGYVFTAMGRTFRALSPFGPLGGIVAALLVVGLVLAAATRRKSGQLESLAVPGSLLLGAVIFVLVTAGAGRVGFASRYISVSAALVLPALAVALDAIARRWRWFVVVAVLLLVVGIPRNIHTAVSAQRFFDPIYGASRHVISTLAADPHLRDAPASLRPEPNAAVWMTAGWLRGAARERRVPIARSLTRPDVESDAFRLSFVEEPLHRPPTGCRPLRHAAVVTLRAGDELNLSSRSILVRPVSRSFDVVPPLTFTQGADEVVVVLHDVGRVRIVFLSRALVVHRPPLQVCASAG